MTPPVPLAPHALSIDEAAARIENGELTSLDLTRAVLDVCARRDDELRAYITRDDEVALARAARADSEMAAGRRLGPLHGIPVGIKDNLDVANMRTTLGSAAHADRVPSTTAPAVQRLIDAGAVVIGKNNLHEFALGVTSENPHFGDVRNPHDTSRIAGGSSGGGAAAIAAGMALGALGTDTSGSIRIPASCCGVTGLKPTYGLVSTEDCFPEAWSLDHVGPMARTVSGVRLLLDAIAERATGETADSDPGQWDGAPHGRRFTVGINDEFYFSGIDPRVQSVVDAAMTSMRADRFDFVGVEIPHIGDAEYALTIIDTAETTTVHRRDIVERPEIYGDDVRFLIECGFLPTAVDYLEAQQMRSVLRKSFARVFDRVDVLISPTIPIPVPELGQKSAPVEGTQVDVVEAMMRLVGPANLLGLPALSLPVGTIGDLPVGLQIIGAAGNDRLVLDVGEAVEQVVGSAP